MNKISNPHDKFFKDVFTRKETAKEFLLNYLPEEIVRLFEPDSLEYTKDSFVDPHLKEWFSDLLFKVYFKRGALGYIYVLLEHKSYHEPLTAFHLLRYMIKIWEMALKAPKDFKLPVIIPVVLYHGTTRWSTGRHFSDLLNASEDLESFIPDFQYVLWNASDFRDEEIKGKVILRVALLLFKYIFREDLQERLPEIFELLKELAEKRTGLEYLETVLKYILNASPTDSISYDDLKSVIENTLPQIGGEIMPTIADTLIERGIQQGIIQNAQEVVIDNLEVRFQHVPEAIVQTVHSIKEPAILKILRRKAIQAQSIEEFERILEMMLT